MYSKLMSKKTKKLYCYVDETGQDAGSKLFVIVSVVSGEEQGIIRNQLEKMEQDTKIGIKKWHTSRSPEKEEFIRNIIKNEIAKGDVYYGKYKKPSSFFFPMMETVEKAIKDKAGTDSYQATVYIDGIDKKKAKELTNILRQAGIRLKYVRSAKDGSEPMIRLADRWAGCIRNAYEGKGVSKSILSRAEKHGYITQITP